MRASLLLLLASSAAASASSSCSPVTLATQRALSRIPPHYASWNIDSSRNRAFFDTDWSAANLLYLTSAIGGGGARIRFGGSGNDALNYAVSPATGPCPPPGVNSECLNTTTATNLLSLASASNCGLIFGLNIHPAQSGPSPPRGPWNSTNAAGLLKWSLDSGFPPLALELGNEQNTIMTAQEQAAAFSVLSGVLDSIFSSDPARRPLLVGPDTHGFHNASDHAFNGPVLKFLADFVSAMNSSGVALSAVTHHEYIEVDQDNVVDPSYLDNTLQIGVQAIAAVRAVSPSMPVWAGEIGPHNGDGSTSASSTCSGNHVCGRFGSTLWYADALGAKAAAGYAGFMRQDLVGADYALLNMTEGGGIFPTPDYYLLKIFRDTLLSAGSLNLTTVVAASPPSGAPPTTRVYAFCGSGQAALLMLNLDNTTSSCVGAPAAAAPGGSMRVFTLTPVADASGSGVTAASAYLNGRLLALDGQGKLPSLDPQVVQVGDVELPPLSVTLAVVPLAGAGAGVCA
jgi:heparanase 1